MSEKPKTLKRTFLGKSFTKKLMEKKKTIVGAYQSRNSDVYFWIKTIDAREAFNEVVEGLVAQLRGAKDRIEIEKQGMRFGSPPKIFRNGQLAMINYVVGLLSEGEKDR